MGTTVATGASTNTDSIAAAHAAVGDALARLTAKPRFGLMFAGPGHKLDRALAAAKAATGVELIGCTTAGEFTAEGLLHGGLVVVLIASDEVEHGLRYATGLKRGHKAVAERIAAGFRELANSAHRRGYAFGTTLTLVDGLCGVGESYTDALQSITGVVQQIVGGAAGDEGKFASTDVGAGGEGGTDAAAAIHVIGKRPWGVGVDHGLTAASDQRMVVTRATDNVIHEIDRKPAFEAYRAFANSRGVALAPETAGAFMIKHELGVYLAGELRRARAPLSVGADGSLTLAAGIRQGSTISILDSNEDEMVRAAKDAALEAKRHLEGTPASGVLVFDCVCRGMMLGDHFGREIDAVREVFPGAPIAGFLTYGEIARYAGKLDGWHNTTAVVVAIPS